MGDRRPIRRRRAQRRAERRSGCAGPPRRTGHPAAGSLGDRRPRQTGGLIFFTVSLVALPASVRVPWVCDAPFFTACFASAPVFLDAWLISRATLFRPPGL